MAAQAVTGKDRSDLAAGELPTEARIRLPQRQIALVATILTVVTAITLATLLGA